MRSAKKSVSVAGVGDVDMMVAEPSILFSDKKISISGICVVYVK